MSRLLSTLAVIWRLAHPYFYSEDRRAGRILLAAVVLIELSLVGINVHDQPLAEHASTTPCRTATGTLSSSS